MKKQYVVSFFKDDVPQARAVLAESEQQAKDFFLEKEPTAVFYGATQDSTDYSKRGMPVETVPDGWTGIAKGVV